jgi:hypothetical protein
MDSRHLSKQHCEWLDDQLGDMAHRLCLIHGPMKERKFPDDDKLFRLVGEAYHALWSAHYQSHALCCQGQMGTTYFFVGDDGNGRTEPSSESPQPHDQPQHHAYQRRGD